MPFSNYFSETWLLFQNSVILRNVNLTKKDLKKKAPQLEASVSQAGFKEQMRAKKRKVRQQEKQVQGPHPLPSSPFSFSLLFQELVFFQ